MRKILKQKPTIHDTEILSDYHSCDSLMEYVDENGKPVSVTFTIDNYTIDAVYDKNKREEVPRLAVSFSDSDLALVVNKMKKEVLNKAFNKRENWIGKKIALKADPDFTFGKDGKGRILIKAIT